MEITFEQLNDFISKSAPYLGWLIPIVLVTYTVGQIATWIRGIFPSRLFQRRNRLKSIQEFAKDISIEEPLRSVIQEIRNEEVINSVFSGRYSLATVRFLAELKTRLGPTTTWESLRRIHRFIASKNNTVAVKFSILDWIALICFSALALDWFIVATVSFLLLIRPESAHLTTLISLLGLGITCLIFCGVAIAQASVLLAGHRAWKLSRMPVERLISNEASKRAKPEVSRGQLLVVKTQEPKPTDS